MKRRTDDLAVIVELLDWITANVERIPPHRRAHARLVLERVERMADTEADDSTEVER